MDTEFWNNHIITHKLIERTPQGNITIGVGPYSSCIDYVKKHPEKIIILRKL